MTNTQIVIRMIERELSRETDYIEDMSDAMVFLNNVLKLLKIDSEPASKLSKQEEVELRLDSLRFATRP